jgi:hypothetical protein
MNINYNLSLLLILLKKFKTVNAIFRYQLKQGLREGRRKEGLREDYIKSGE